MILCFLIWFLLFWFLIFFSPVRFIILFNFTIQSKIYFDFLCQFQFSFFWFFCLFAKLIFLYNFTLQSNIKFLLIMFFLIDFFFNFIFQYLINWKKKFLFFHIGCFEFNDLDHEFKKLTWVFFKKNFIILFIFYQVISISWSESWVWRDIWGWLDPDYRGYESIMLTRVDYDKFFHVFFSSFCSFIFNRLRIEIHRSSHFEKIFFSHVFLIIFLFKFDSFIIVFFFVWLTSLFHLVCLSLKLLIF